MSLQPPVFISYSSLDEKRALALVNALEQRSIACWMAKRDIKVSENYADKIPEVISNAPGFVLVYSRNADSSPEVKKELQLASSFKKTIFPIRLEDVRPTKAFQYELATVQWIDAFEGWDVGVDQLAKGLKDVIATEGTGEGSARPKPLLSPQPSRSPKSRLLIVAGLGLVGVCVAGALVLIERSRPPEAPQQQTSDTPHAPSPGTKPVEPKQSEPKWQTLPPGSNFANRGKDRVPVRKSPAGDSPVLVDIPPGATLYFNGVLPAIAQASIDSEVWLRLDTQPGPGFVIKSSLSPFDSKSVDSK